MADGCDVTIYLVHKEQGSTEKQKRRSLEYALENGSPALAIDSTRLCQCGKCFETWMRQRRTMQTHMEDTLESDATEFWVQ